MNWSKEDVFLLVDLVRRRPCLYDRESESFKNEKKKLNVAEELAEIMSSTRPGTSVGEVLQKWADMCVQFILQRQKVVEKKKDSSKLFYYEKMQFMLPHLKTLINPLSIANKENKNKINKEVTENDARPNHTEDNHSEMCTPPTKKRCADVSQIEERQKSSEDSQEALNESSRESITTLSVYSGTPSPVYSTPVQLSEPRWLRRRKRNLLPATENTTLHDVSCVTLPSPLVCVNDSILDRTETFDDRKSFSNAEWDDSFVKEDEDTLYSKYIACKLKKLDETKKLKFKVEVEKLFYESMK